MVNHKAVLKVWEIHRNEPWKQCAFEQGIAYASEGGAFVWLNY